MGPGHLKLTKALLQRWIYTLLGHSLVDDEDVWSCLFMCILLDTVVTQDDPLELHKQARVLWSDCNRIPCMRPRTDMYFAHCVLTHFLSYTTDRFHQTPKERDSVALYFLCKMRPQKHQPRYVVKRATADHSFLKSSVTRPIIVSAIVNLLLHKAVLSGLEKDRKARVDSMREIVRVYAFRHSDHAFVRQFVENLFKADKKSYVVGLFAIKRYVLDVMLAIGIPAQELSPAWKEYVQGIDSSIEHWNLMNDVSEMLRFKTRICELSPRLVIPTDFWSWVHNEVSKGSGTSRVKQVQFARCRAPSWAESCSLFALLFKDVLSITESEFGTIFSLLYTFFFDPVGNDRQKAVIENGPSRIFSILADIAATWMHFRRFTYHSWPVEFDVMDKVKLRMLNLCIPRSPYWTALMTCMTVCENCMAPRTVLNEVPTCDRGTCQLRTSDLTTGSKEVKNITSTSDHYCGRTGSNSAEECPDNPCAAVSLLNRFVYFNGKTYCLCTECAFPMQWAAEFVIFARSGPICSGCTMKRQ